MTKVTITIEADVRAAGLATEGYESFAAAVERELRRVDLQQPTMGRRDEAEVTHCFVRTEYGHLLGRAGRGFGWG